VDALLDHVVEILSLLLGSGFLLVLWLRWRDRPRLRVRVKDFGFFGDDRDLVFEATNEGGRVTSLRPVIRMDGLAPNMSRRFWCPWNLRMLKVPIERSGRPVSFEYDLRELESKLDPHQTREFHGQPRRPPPAMILFRTYRFRLAAGRRYRLRFHHVEPRPLSRWRFWWGRLRWSIRGWVPPTPGSWTLDDWTAERQSRG